MNSSTKNEPKALRDVAYYRQRFQNRVFATLVDFVSTQAKAENITKKDLAERLGRDPGQVSRLLGYPSNLTLDTISDLLLALDAEAEPPVIELFAAKRPSNYMHPLIARALKLERPTEKLKSESSGSSEVRLDTAGASSGPRIKTESVPV